MNQGTHPEELPAEVLADVARVVGAEVTVLSRLPGGVNGGAMRVQLAGRAHAVLKAVPRAHPGHLDETLRAQRVAEHMRRRGHPTPAGLAVGATATHVWHLMDIVDAAPVPELTPSIVEQMMEIVEIQAGQASEPGRGGIAAPAHVLDHSLGSQRLVQVVGVCPGHCLEHCICPSGQLDEHGAPIDASG